MVYVGLFLASYLSREYGPRIVSIADEGIQRQKGSTANGACRLVKYLNKAKAFESK
jgi:hypothetical protein